VAAVKLSAASDKIRYTAGDLLEMIRRRYAPKQQTVPEWAVLPQVRAMRGFGLARTADVIVMNLWPSRGLQIIGCEIKVSRADFRRELADVGKADALMRYCDHWYVVASPGVVIPRPAKPEAGTPLFNDESAAHIDEVALPASWGLMEPRGNELVVVKPAPQLDPDPVDRHFVANVLLQAQRHVVPSDELEAVRDAAYERGLRAGAEDERRKRRGDDVEERLSTLTRLEEILDRKLDHLDAERTAALLRMVDATSVAQVDRHLAGIEDEVVGLLETIRRARKGEHGRWHRLLSRRLG
jgi:hypothetical protein